MRLKGVKLTHGLMHAGMRYEMLSKFRFCFPKTDMTGPKIQSNTQIEIPLAMIKLARGEAGVEGGVINH